MKAYALVGADTPALAAVAAGVPLASALRASLDELRPGHRADLSRRGRRLRRDLPAPEQQSLVQLQKAVDWYKNETLEKVGFYRMALRFSQAPTPIRRLLWWGTLNISGYKRCKRFGTFGLSSYGSLGAEQIHPISPLTTTLTYGPIDPTTRRVVVKLIYDHRVLDGVLHRPPAPRHRRTSERPDPRGTARRRPRRDDRSVGRTPPMVEPLLRPHLPPSGIDREGEPERQIGRRLSASKPGGRSSRAKGRVQSRFEDDASRLPASVVAPRPLGRS